MTEPSISFRLQAADAKSLAGQFRHDRRIGTQPSYVDASKADRNRVLYRADDFEIIKSRAEIEARAKRKTSAAKYWRTAILTFSHKAQARLDERNVTPHEEAKAAFADFATRHGVKLLSVDFHGDESAPHYHASFEGVTKAGYALRLNRAELSQEQDHVASHFANLGLTRGKRRVDRQRDGEDPSKWVNRSVKELHEQLPGELAALQEQIEAAWAKVQKNEALAEKARIKATENDEKATQALKRVETYERRAESAREALKSLAERQRARENTLTRLIAAVNTQKAELETVKAAVAQKKTKIDSLKARLQSLNAA